MKAASAGGPRRVKAGSGVRSKTRGASRAVCSCVGRVEGIAGRTVTASRGPRAVDAPAVAVYSWVGAVGSVGGVGSGGGWATVSGARAVGARVAVALAVVGVDSRCGISVRKLF